MEPQGGPRTDPEIREGRGNDFLGGLGEKRPCPKASWVPYNPFPSYRIPCNPMGDHFFHKTIFFRAHFWSKKVPGPAGVQIWDRGSQKSPPGLKIPKLRAEKPCRIQWSVFQTEPYVASYDIKPSGAHNAKWCKCELWAYRLPPPARISGSGGISTQAFLRGSSQPPSWPKSA